MAGPRMFTRGGRTNGIRIFALEGLARLKRRANLEFLAGDPLNPFREDARSFLQSPAGSTD